MSTQDVSRLERYRSRRAHRLAQARALYSGDPARSRLVEGLAAAITVVGGDRGAVLWIDEYGPAASHVFCLIDLIGEAPRRDFPLESLRDAWNQGVPGLHDVADRNGSAPRGGVRSSVTIALGSDGTRAWFLSIDSLTPRARLSGSQLDRLFFQAGETASVVLHRDQDSDAGGTGREAFAGWSILKDIEGHGTDDAASRRIATRFLIARLVRAVVDADFGIERGVVSDQLKAAEREFGVVPANDPERESWGRVAAAVRTQDPAEVAVSVVELADRVAAQGHLEGSRELFESAYQVGVAAGLSGPTIDAARFLGRTHRDQAAWDASFRWYAVAEELCLAFGDDARLGLVFDGLGNSYRLSGDVERAIVYHRKAYELGAEMADEQLRAWGAHGLMGDYQALRRPIEALEYGWEAFGAYPSARSRMRVLTNLAWVFVELGDHATAEHVYRIVLAQSSDFIHRLNAMDALAYIAAERGDRSAFEAGLTELDGMAWRDSSAFTVGQFLFYRGRGYAVLGELATAEALFDEAEEFSEGSGNQRVVEQVREAREELKRWGAIQPLSATIDSTGADRGALARVREGLYALSVSAVGT